MLRSLPAAICWSAALWLPASALAGVTEIQLEVGSISGPGLSQPLRELALSCRLQVAEGVVRCDAGQLSARGTPAGRLTAGFDFEHRATTQWSARLTRLRSDLGAGEASVRADDAGLHLRGRLDGLDTARAAVLLGNQGIGLPLTPAGRLGATVNADSGDGSRWRGRYSLKTQQIDAAEASGRYAAEKLDAHADGDFDWQATRLLLNTRIQIDGGQAYVEPVFNDFSTQGAKLAATLEWLPRSGMLTLRNAAFEQRGVGSLHGSARGSIAAGLASWSGELRFDALQLGAAFSTYAQPFLDGRRLQDLQFGGVASGAVSFAAGAPDRVDLQLDGVSAESAAVDAGLRGLQGNLAWHAAETAGAASSLRWSGGHLGKLELAGAELVFATHGRELALLAPLRQPVLDGALRVDRLRLRALGLPQLAAEFDATIEPIDLRELCRALGWPEFGGQLSGRLPGLRLENQQLSLDGALEAQAFDGSIRVDGLQVLDPFGRLPRLLADIELRNLDLAALTGAFSFGRIDGRLSGDVRQLRLLNWVPVAFDAHLYTPADDRSRHRISQRAIDNISSLGGGPTGVLSRGALRFFDDFAYARIGWSCVLKDGVCTMDGVEPKGEGYVLVKGRLLPRIDVVGYTRRVDWNTFLEQLKSVQNADQARIE